MKNREIADLAVRYGFELKRQKNHAVYHHPVTNRVVIVSTSPSTQRFLKCVEKDMKRASQVGGAR